MYQEGCIAEGIPPLSDARHDVLELVDCWQKLPQAPMRDSDAAQSHYHHQKRVQTRRPPLAASRHPVLLPARRSDRGVLALSFASNTSPTAAVLPQPRKLLEPPPSLPCRPSPLPRSGQPDKQPAKIPKVELLETACFPFGPSFPRS